jgi:hypothetical protein
MTAPLKADVTAADRLLKAAVRYAVESFRYWGDAAYDCADVVEILEHAGYGATLLLSERAS